MHCPSHPPWLDHSNYSWRRVQVMKLLIMQFNQWLVKKILMTFSIRKSHCFETTACSEKRETRSALVSVTLVTAPSWFPVRYNSFLYPAEGPDRRSNPTDRNADFPSEWTPRLCYFNRQTIKSLPRTELLSSSKVIIFNWKTSDVNYVDGHMPFYSRGSSAQN
jgi:hypothetical protein